MAQGSLLFHRDLDLDACQSMGESGKRGGQGLGSSGGTPATKRHGMQSLKDDDDDKDVSNKDIKQMLTQVMDKLDSLGTKADASMLLAQKAKTDATAAKQANFETRQAMAVMEEDFKHVNADVQSMKQQTKQAPTPAPTPSQTPASRTDEISK